MPIEQAYVTELPWDAQRPDTVVITCVDGRWYRHFQEFARTHLQAGPCTDFMAVPGGVEPMTLADDVPKDFNFFRRRLEALVEAHGTGRIVVIAHQDCAWYRSRMSDASAEAMRAKQVADMRRAASWLRNRFAGVAVQSFFARLSGTQPQKVVFEEVSALP
jgi:carbonic anhydrase